MAGREADRQPEGVRQELAPERAAREAARRPHLADLVARVAHRVQDERELQAHALERGADEVPPPVGLA